jgi:transcriptional regulator with XRE-family HTH domain
MKLQEKIAEYRKANDLTQSEFAELGGLTREAVQAIENGRVENPGLETLLGIAKAMNISIDELVKE